MQLPEQLRKQVEQVNLHFSELQNPAPAEPAESAPQQPAAESALTEPTPPAEPDAQSVQPAEPEPSQPQQSQQALAYWQNRFGILQGKYNAEVPALNVRVKELERQLAEAKAAPAAAPTAQQAIDTIKQLTDEQLAEFGQDTVAMVETLIARRIGQAEPATPDPELAQKLERLERAEQQREEERLQDTQARFWAAVQAGIPNLHAVNGDPAFHQWLAKFDPLSGIQRQQALAAAQSALDADRVVAIFNNYFQETGQMPVKKREVPPEEIQPPQSRSTATPPAEAKVWTGPEITQFYNDKARGRYSREEADRIEADIFAATSSGRVR